MIYGIYRQWDYRVGAPQRLEIHCMMGETNYKRDLWCLNPSSSVQLFHRQAWGSYISNIILSKSRWCLDDIYSNSCSTEESSMENKPDENCQYDLKKIDFVHDKLRWWMQNMNQRVWRKSKIRSNFFKALHLILQGTTSQMLLTLVMFCFVSFCCAMVPVNQPHAGLLN